LVGAGFGSTLVPALAIRGGWMTDSGIIARRFDIDDAYRRISLVFRRSFPRRSALEAFAETLIEQLPNTVRPLARGR
jgi:LysR family hydrogen peroxide-inducible transcriptional activator